MAAEWLHSKGGLVLAITGFFQMSTMWEISSLARKRSTEHGLDGQLCGVLDIWWQTQTKNYTAQDAGVARVLKFPGTCNAPTFETIC